MAPNKRPGVGAETRQRIIKIAEKLDYQPNYDASMIKAENAAIEFKA